MAVSSSQNVSEPRLTRALWTFQLVILDFLVTDTATESGMRWSDPDYGRKFDSFNKVSQKINPIFSRLI